MLIAFAASGVLGLAAVAAVIALANRGGGGTANAADVPTTLQAAGCTFKTVKATGRTHVTSLDAKIKYNTSPPSNGNHYSRRRPGASTARRRIRSRSCTTRSTAA